MLYTRYLAIALLVTSLGWGCKNSPDGNGDQTPTNNGEDAGPVEELGEDYEFPFYDADPTVEQPEDNPAFEEHPNLAQIMLPPGFQIRMYAEVPNARSLELADDGTLFVGNRSGDKVFAVTDTDGDMKADESITIASGMNMPNGVALHEGDLYVAEVNKVWRYPDILDSLPDVPEKQLVNDDFPDDRHHGWKFIKFGPDGKLYVPVGAPCNICKTDYNEYSNIMRMNPDGSELEMYVKGVRNTVGFDWDPVTDDLWFTDNGRDRMGDNRPPDELNHVTEQGQHFGYPFCHGGFILDPEFGEDKDCADYRPPAQNLGPHVAALGMEFYEGEMFPDEYDQQIFIAEHGSWNRSEKIGYRVMLVRLDENREPTSLEVFARGWLQGESSWGRPVDVEVMGDGSLLVSDDAAGAVYRIVYVGE
jgi:glucose/arabinose dehydrogenase